MNIKWNKILDWSISSVSDVLPVKNNVGAITGYKVVVQYAHHGRRELYFGNNQTNLYSQYNGPKDAAERMREQYIKLYMKQNQGKLR